MARKSGSTRVTSLQSGVDSARKKIVEIRHKAADAALHWVLAHDERVSAFRRSVKDTPIEKAFDALLSLLRTEARGAKPARKRSAAKRPRKRAAKSA